MLFFKCLTLSGDECHRGAIKAFSYFQRPAARSPGPQRQSPLLLQRAGELFVYLGTGLLAHIMVCPRPYGLTDSRRIFRLWNRIDH